MSVDTKQIWDQEITVPSINKLNEAIQEDVIKLILIAQKEGIYLRIPSNGGYISFEEQRIAFQDRKSSVSPGGTYHNYGLAFDVLPLQDTKNTLEPRLSDGKRTITNDQWERVGKIGKSLGFEWGGDWLKTSDPHPRFDSSHFQIPRDIITLEELKDLKNIQKRDLVTLPDDTKNKFNINIE